MTSHLLLLCKLDQNTINYLALLVKRSSLSSAALEPKRRKSCGNIKLNLRSTFVMYLNKYEIIKKINIMLA